MTSAPSSGTLVLSFRAMILMPLSASTTALDLCVAWSRETQITEYYRTVQAEIST